jgi:hypothetical protein
MPTARMAVRNKTEIAVAVRVASVDRLSLSNKARIVV